MCRATPYKGKGLNHCVTRKVDEIRLMDCQFDTIKPEKGRKIEVKSLFLCGTNFIISSAVDLVSIESLEIAGKDFRQIIEVSPNSLK